MEQLLARKPVTVEFDCGPADLQAYLARVEEQLEVARPLLARWDELTPQQQRRYENAPAAQAPMILRVLDSQPRSVGTFTRPREHRARRSRTRTGAKSRSSRGDPDGDDEPGGAGQPRLHVIP